MKTGNRAMKSVSGFDLTRLFVGSEGVLGIVTEIILKISPKPLATATTLAIFDDLEDAGRAVSGVMACGVIPSVLEILGRETLRAINQNTELNLPEVDAMLLAETDGYTQGEADYPDGEGGGAVQGSPRPRGEAGRERGPGGRAVDRAQELRTRCWPGCRPNFILEDITVPMSQVAPMLRGVQDIAARHQVQFATFGHAGDGNLHPQMHLRRIRPGREPPGGGRGRRTCSSWPWTWAAPSPASTASGCPRPPTWPWSTIPWPWI